MATAKQLRNEALKIGKRFTVPTHPAQYLVSDRGFHKLGVKGPRPQAVTNRMIALRHAHDRAVVRELQTSWYTFTMESVTNFPAGDAH